jgi:hypothetical protein
MSETSHVTAEAAAVSWFSLAAIAGDLDAVVRETATIVAESVQVSIERRGFKIEGVVKFGWVCSITVPRRSSRGAKLAGQEVVSGSVAETPATAAASTIQYLEWLKTGGAR